MKGLPDDPKAPPSPGSTSRTTSKALTLTFLALLARASLLLTHHLFTPTIISKTDLCTQAPHLSPSDHAASANYETIFNDELYRNASAQRLSDFVKIPSESYNDNGLVGEDPRWDVFEDIPTYLAKAFPLVHSHLNVTRVNSYALLYHFPGSDNSLKPVLLTGHLDVVPVNPATVDQWTHPPYSGYFDGETVWGRGSVDCKDTVNALLEAVELLLRTSWKPIRSLILAFGFDEESAGTQGALKLSKYLKHWLGEDSIAFLVDEGGGGVAPQFGGTVMALPGTAEKGQLNVKISVDTPGGHSSLPPPHTSIGILSQLIVALEKSPYKPSLPPTSPILSLLQCAATHGNLPSPLPELVFKANSEKGIQKLVQTYAARGREEKFLVTTSQAVDLIQGGVKVNALPENAEVTINYRIAIDSSTKVVKERVTKHILEIAREHDLSVDAFNVSYLSSGAAGKITSVGIFELEAAPTTLTTTPQWALLSGTIQHAFSNKFPEGVIVSPGMDTGGTDTRFYWDLTRDIYRFSPLDPKNHEFIHTVNEHISIIDHLQATWFFHELIRNADEAVF